MLPLAIPLVALLALAPAAVAAGPPRPVALSSGWQVRAEAAAPADPQLPPAEESAPEDTTPPGQPTPPGPGLEQDGAWRATTVPSVFEPRAIASLYPGSVRTYRVRFRGPATPRGFSWKVVFESVRRSARVSLNGRRIGSNIDPYTPFEIPAAGLRARRMNELVVRVDGRKDRRIREGWWNWNGIVRPVRLEPVGRAHLSGLGTMSRVRCRGRATGCRAELLLDGTLERRGSRRTRPTLDVLLRAPGGRITRRRFRLPAQSSAKQRVRLSMRVPAPRLWSPDQPNLYRASFTLREGSVQQVVRRNVGLRSVTVKGGMLRLNNRRIQVRGASIHEDMPGSGAALTEADMDRIVADLKEVGANVTRAHYLLNERLLDKLDRAGIFVWNQAPIWQRDHGANLLQYPVHRRRALLTVRRTIKAGRSHPSVLTHSVANELSFTPDVKLTTRRFLLDALAYARDLDPTAPVAIDIKGRPGWAEQFTYHGYDIVGLNQYFGWYRWVEDFEDLEPWINEQSDHYPGQALVMTEFGSEARPELAGAPPELKGGYAFQANHLTQTLDVIDRSRVLSGAIYWTLREFEIYPGWTGGAGRRPKELEPNTRHHKGLLGYTGEKKPSWYVARERFGRIPLYP